MAFRHSSRQWLFTVSLAVGFYFHWDSICSEFIYRNYCSYALAFLLIFFFWNQFQAFWQASSWRPRAKWYERQNRSSMVAFRTERKRVAFGGAKQARKIQGARGRRHTVISCRRRTTLRLERRAKSFDVHNFGENCRLFCIAHQPPRSTASAMSYSWPSDPAVGQLRRSPMLLSLSAS